MGDDLMAEQVEVDPPIAAAPLATAQHFTVEVPRGLKIVDWKGQMKGRELAQRAGSDP